MNQQLTKLFEIAQKPERLIIGLMSGTSLDGLDIALCKISGSGEETNIEVLNFETVEYSPALRSRLSAVQSKAQTDTKELTILNSELGFLYGDWVLGKLNKWNFSKEEVDLIASHGQTVFHAPSEDKKFPNSTFQMVDADHIAHRSGIITISDFRQKHTAAGGEGAPLAGIFDEVMFRSPNKNRMLLNLGGIANFTWLPSKESKKETKTSDTGPANTLMNEAMIKYFSRPYDEGGKVAAKGNVHSELLKYALLEPYFRKSFPKTTGQEDFKLAYIEDLMKGHQIELSHEDLLATLTAITIYSVSRAVDEIAGEENFECYVSGGGVHNTALMNGLKSRMPNAEFKEFEELGVSPDAKESAIMALFANECLAGEGFLIPGTEKRKVHLGKISLPD
ncbi:MAG: anhydro-N-acetylmuramic acid kinase [Balneolaceae bacterium]